LLRLASNEPIFAPSDSLFNFKALRVFSSIENIQPDAQFLFTNLTELEFELAAPTTSNHPFSVFGCMPKLQELEVTIRDWLARLDKFPNLVKLKSLSISLKNVTVAPDAFDHLTGLDVFCVNIYGREEFETGLAPSYLHCGGYLKKLKLNSLDVHKIEEMSTFENECDLQIESLLPLVGLKKLTTSTDCFYKFYQQLINIETLILYFYTKNESCLNQHLRCMPNLRNLELCFYQDLEGLIFLFCYKFGRA
jgi:hypothetical protein